LHASSVRLILNLQTGNVMPQYHVVHDDFFKTVYADGTEPPPEWAELVMLNRSMSAFEQDKEYIPELKDKWLMPEECQCRWQQQVRQRQMGNEREKPEVQSTNVEVLALWTTKPENTADIPNKPKARDPSKEAPARTTRHGWVINTLLQYTENVAYLFQMMIDGLVNCQRPQEQQNIDTLLHYLPPSNKDQSKAYHLLSESACRC